MWGTWVDHQNRFLAAETNPHESLSIPRQREPPQQTLSTRHDLHFESETRLSISPRLKLSKKKNFFLAKVDSRLIVNGRES